VDSVTFGFGAGNVVHSDNANVTVPAAVVSVLKIGLQKTNKASPITVDAAEVNPAPPVRRRKSG
jgi:hypothetical protein